MLKDPPPACVEALYEYSIPFRKFGAELWMWHGARVFCGPRGKDCIEFAATTPAELTSNVLCVAASTSRDGTATARHRRAAEERAARTNPLVAAARPLAAVAAAARGAA